MTALRFQTGGRHPTFPASLQGLRQQKTRNKDEEFTHNQLTILNELGHQGSQDRKGGWGVHQW